MLYGRVFWAIWPPRKFGPIAPRAAPAAMETTSPSETTGEVEGISHPTPTPVSHKENELNKSPESDPVLHKD